MVLILAMLILIIKGKNCNESIKRVIKTYVVSDFSCNTFEHSSNRQLSTIELSPALDGAYKIWYQTAPSYQSEYIVFSKSFKVIGEIQSATFIGNGGDFILLYFNSVYRAITENNNRDTLQNFTINEFIVSGNNYIWVYVYNYKDNIGFLQFKIIIESIVYE